MQRSGFEPGLLRPQRSVLTTRPPKLQEKNHQPIKAFPPLHTNPALSLVQHNSVLLLAPASSKPTSSLEFPSFQADSWNIHISHTHTHQQELPATAQNLIISTPRTSVIYFKPKIHKPNNPGRPILSAYSCPTELISQYLDQIMSPFVKSPPSYIKDTNHALKTFRDFHFPGQNKLIFTMDITSLYTVIPNHEGLLALKYFFDQRANKQPSTAYSPR